jgi:hypothetical protein
MNMKPILEIATAAKMAGFSIRHFRRIIQADRVRVIRIGRKFFITGNDFSEWARTKKLMLRET